MLRKISGALILVVCCLSQNVLAEEVTHAVSLYGQPKYPADFDHFAYANPSAPKQGELVIAEIGSFDSLHQFINLGTKPRGLFWLYDSLTDRGHDKDEIKTRYGALAETITIADDYSWVKYQLRKGARFSDGQPVTAEDVAFTVEKYKTVGLSNIKSRFQGVRSVEVLGPREVKFNFGDHGSRLQVLNAGNLPVLPKHVWQGKDFTKPTLDIPVGSGPYRITAVVPGRSITYSLRNDYWGKDLPVNRGKYNFKTIRVEYFRDRNAAVQALAAGEVNYIAESNLARWQKLYQGKAFDSGTVVKEKIDYDAPSFVTALLFNLREAKFANPKTREALAYAFDFEWLNKRAFQGQYQRAESLFNNSFLASAGHISPQESEVLAPFKQELPPALFSGTFHWPATDGSGRDRDNLIQAKKLLEQAGWKTEQGKLVDANHQPFVIHFLVPSPAMKPALGAYLQNLKRLGIEGQISVRTGTEFYKQLMQRQFDMTPIQYKVRIPPNTEVRSALLSSFADVATSNNIAGFNDPVIDALVEDLVHADSYRKTEVYGKALDRVLKWKYYFLPLWARNFQLVAHADYIQRPEVDPAYGYEVEFWWDSRRDHSAQ
ncbi:extracellular solute-binding protein [Vibrio mangrovi]|uniref:Extracellular solute-binding protein n=1 Tax=Vibrio mangrovi TaxID=474394 RepID=A0A1Y6IQM4_9VIBR|nr:extracellular solute-binding protein [Vibrio mangrovi]MDW6003275.1 extracellular solute-binding protein [Vibrio mangrovi]SMR99936.1 Oligopeptide-binding protein AppA precursor [Vibrio mangrovi]